MSIPANHEGIFRSRSPVATLVWLAVALALCLIVAVANRTPTAYFDTGLYLDRGQHTLGILGLEPKASAPAEADTAAGAGATEDGNGASEGSDGTTSGSRSVFYAVFLAGALNFADLRIVPVVQAVALIATILISVRIMVRRYGLAPSPAALTALAVAGAAIGSAPFYVAFLMPDIFAPILLLVVAGFAAFTGDMRPWEILALYALAVVAILTHPSHLAMAIVLVPPALLVILLFGTRRKWIAAMMVIGIPLAGFVEHLSFRTAVEKVTHSEVVYTPFMTARLIVDGPGLDYLRAVCPDPEVATCALLPMLEEPQRVTPFNILFELDPELGSLALLPKETQRAIMAEQVDFARSVVLSRPFGVTRAVVRNTLVQLRKYSFLTTLTEPSELAGIRKSAFDLPPHFDRARLSGGQAWVAPTLAVHATVYVVSALLIVVLSVWPGSGLPAQLRCWSLMLLTGIVANAFVCGAVSQPAMRYGARVLFLLPMAALLLTAILLALQSSANKRSPRPSGSLPIPKNYGDVHE